MVKNYQRAASFFMVFILCLTMILGVVPSVLAAELPDVLLELPKQNYDTNYYLIYFLETTGKYICFNFDTLPTVTYLNLSECHFYPDSVDLNFDRYESDGISKWAYISNFNCPFDTHINFNCPSSYIVYSSFDVKNVDGSILYPANTELPTTSPTEPEDETDPTEPEDEVTDPNYSLVTFISDSSSFTTAMVSQLYSWIGFVISNPALLWIFIAGVSLLVLKLILILF